MGRQQKYATSLWAAGLMLFLAAGNTIRAEGPPRILVLGCESRIDDEQWRDFRINFGVTNLIAEAVADRGGFRLVEEKERIREQVAALRDDLWERGYKKARKRIETLAGADSGTAVAVGRLVYFGAPREAARFGGFSSKSNKVVIGVEVEIIFPGKKKIRGMGRGEAVRTASSVLLEFSDTGIFFDQSTVGEALRKAVTAAANDALTRASRYWETRENQ